VLVTLVVVVLAEAIVLGYQAPQLLDAARLEGPAVATANSYVQQFLSRDPTGGLARGTLLGDPDEPAQPGHAQLGPGGDEFSIPAISGPISDRQAITAVVVIAADGTIIASSAPYRYPSGRAAASLLPGDAATAIAQGRPKLVGTGSTPYGRVTWALAGLFGSAAPQTESNPVASVYVQAPRPSGFMNPTDAWNSLSRRSDAGTLLWVSYGLLAAIVPAGALFGLLASRRLVRRVRRLERATIAVAGGDYMASLPISGRDEIGRLETNFNIMTQQLYSAVTAERERASADALATERNRLARELHDTISQHLFSLRMIAGGLRRADPSQHQAHAIERIAEEAIGDMQTLLYELRPPSLERAGLVAALEELCEAYRSRLGVEVVAELPDIAMPPEVEFALLRITQEAFTNAIRHGHAHRLVVSASRANGHVELCVRDNGRGFDPTAPHEGSGLRHIRDRVAELGGTVHIDSASERGCAVTARIPVPV
jgi:signal transduction histidine kinase